MLGPGMKPMVEDMQAKHLSLDGRLRAQILVHGKWGPKFEAVNGGKWPFKVQEPAFSSFQGVYIMTPQWNGRDGTHSRLVPHLVQ